MDKRRFKSLLYPIVAFLQEGGFSKADSLEILSSVFESLQRKKTNRRMQHIGHPTRYADIIAAWTRDRAYVDPLGKPRALSLTGAKGFASLVQRISPGTNVQTALSVLLRYRNIRFYANSNSDAAFEPIAFFLSDASATLSEILKRQQRTLRPERFWRKVESVSVSEDIARGFAAFARERSFIFLEELDDWLEAHRGGVGGTSRKSRRIGLGLFSIYSDYEGGSHKSSAKL
jgi:hypothetical protein